MAGTHKSVVFFWICPTRRLQNTSRWVAVLSWVVPGSTFCVHVWTPQYNMTKSSTSINATHRYAQFNESPRKWAFERKLLGLWPMHLRFGHIPWGFAKASCFILQEKSSSKTTTEFSFRHNRTNIFLGFAKTLAPVHFSLLPRPKINFILWRRIFPPVRLNLQDCAVGVKFGMHVSGLASNEVRCFYLCSTFFDEWFGRSNWAQKRLTSVGYAHRNSWRL